MNIKERFQKWKAHKAEERKEEKLVAGFRDIRRKESFEEAKNKEINRLQEKQAEQRGKEAAFRKVNPLGYAAQKMAPNPQGAWQRPARSRNMRGYARPRRRIPFNGPRYTDVDVVGRNLQQFEPQIRQHADPVNFGQQMPLRKRRPFNAGNYL